jgi:hypothetical protein
MDATPSLLQRTSRERRALALRGLDTLDIVLIVT